MKIYEKIQNIINSSLVSLDSQNKFQHFKYASLGAFLETLKPLMRDNGIQIIRKEVELVKTIKLLHDEKQIITKKLVQIYKATYQIINMQEPNDIIVVSYTAPMDTTQSNLIQAYGATLTYLWKYMYRDIFKVEFADDIDPDEVNNKTTMPEKRVEQIENKSIVTSAKTSSAKSPVKKDGITEAQGKLLWAKMKNAGFKTNEEMTDYTFKLYGKKQFSELTYIELNEILEKIKNKEIEPNEPPF